MIKYPTKPPMRQYTTN